MKNIRKKLPILGIIIGLIMLGAYPAYDLISTIKSRQVIDQLDNTVSYMSNENAQEYLDQAHAYNDQLAGKKTTISPIWPYEKQLNLSGENTAFAELLIPKIAIDMPIYHGSNEAVLSAGVGHIERSSLPVGGKDTHCILTAHSGMRGMRAFDDLRLLEPGDYFAVRTLRELYGYKVYNVETVLPNELDKLQIQEGKDLCTLITCTPYGVNTHRLLVHGERAELPDDFLKQHPKWQDVVTNRRYAPFIIGASIVLLLIIGAIIRRKRRKKRVSRTDS